MRRLPALLLIALALTAGIGPRKPVSRDSNGFVVAYLTDIHYQGSAASGVGDGVKGAERYRRFITWCNSNVDAVILGGDFAWETSDRDSILLLLSQFNVPVYPKMDNHEVNLADSASGNVWDSWTANFPALYNPYVSGSDRGSRWYGRRIGNSPFMYFSIQANRDTSAGTAHYWTQNPKDGSGVLLYDFDGVSDSTSAQRQDFRKFYQTMEYNDLPIVSIPRAMHQLNGSTLRPNLESAHNGPNLSPLVWLDQYFYGVGRRYILGESDVHGTFIMKQHYQHFPMMASVADRAKSNADIATWSTRLKMFALDDSAWGDSDYPTVDDSLGATAVRLGNGYWTTFITLTSLGERKVRRTVYLLKYNNATITSLGSDIIQL